MWTPPSARTRLREPQLVGAVVQEVFDASIVIATGSNATVVPLGFENCGVPIQERGSLQDCQGHKTPTSGMREFHFVLQDVNGKTVVLKGYGFLSGHVSRPLISYGHFFVWSFADWRMANQF